MHVSSFGTALMFLFPLSSHVVLCSVSELCLAQEHVDALFLRIQEKKIHCCCELFNLGDLTHITCSDGTAGLRHNSNTAAKIHAGVQATRPFYTNCHA